MYVEIQVALNFMLTFLYNQLPRRRVNIFADSLLKVLARKFYGHWYPDKPYRGSAYRCLRMEPNDAALNMAAKESGTNLFEFLEYLPIDMCIWIDPGEVSYRIGEKGPIRVIFTDFENYFEEHKADREVMRTFNPDAPCFQPLETFCPYYGGYPVYTMDKPPSPYGYQQGPAVLPYTVDPYYGTAVSHDNSTPSIPYTTCASPIPTFLPRPASPLTFTTATFAQTKFGSTKLKNSGKRANRMTQAEFANYIRQRVTQRQVQQPITFQAGAPSHNGQNYQATPDNHYYQQGQAHFQQGQTHYPQEQTHYPPQFAIPGFYNSTQYVESLYNNYSQWENFHSQYVPQQQNQPQQQQPQAPLTFNPIPSNNPQDNNIQQPQNNMNNYGTGNRRNTKPYKGITINDLLGPN